MKPENATFWAQDWPRACIGCLNRQRLLIVGLLLVVAGVLTSCGGPSDTPQATASPSSETSAGQGVQPQEPQDLTRVDNQGAVEFAVIPLDLPTGSGGEMRFQVSMNTHSVDLSMDLSQLSTLETDLGMSLPALSWSGGNGHHVQGILGFPVMTSDGTPLVSGAHELTLRIRDVDATERVFVWELNAE